MFVSLNSCQAQSVQVPIDTSKATVPIPVATTFKAADGVWWQVSGTLTLKPIPAPTGSASLPPSILSVKPVETGPGLQVSISGSGFGGDTGTVWLNEIPMQIDFWGDAKINATAPYDAKTGLLIVERDDAMTIPGPLLTIKEF